MENRTKKAFENLYEYLALRSTEAGDDLRIIEKAVRQNRKENEKTVLKGERRRVIEMIRGDIIKEIIELVEEMATDPPLESNERRRGYQLFADDIIFKLK